MTSTPPSTAPVGPDSGALRGPARFQVSDPAAPKQTVAASVGSAIVLLLLVVGLPVALIWLGGIPGVPTSLPSRAQLTATIGPEQLLGVLVWVVWLAWLQFVICVLVELRSALSGVGLPSRVPLAAPSQRFARTLVASVLLLVMAAGQANAVTQAQFAPTHEQASGTSISQVAGDQGAEVATASAAQAASDAAAAAASTAAASTAASAAATAAEGDVTYQFGGLELSPEEGAQLVGKRVYVVTPPEGRYHDNLWDIAERDLGDGRRYQEIFELNKGRDQPDGQELTLERLIYPQWLLIMPEDAAGVERVTAVVTPAPAPAATVVAGAATAGPGAQVLAASPAAEAVGSPATAVTAAAATSNRSTESGVTGQSLLGAGLLAAGLLAAIDQLRRRRRTNEPSDPAVEVEVALRVGADPDRAARLDSGLRGLSAALRDAGRDLPGAYAAVVDGDAITLHLAPADPAAPAPWSARDEGRRWVLAAADDSALPARTAPAPFPGLVTLGRDAAGADVLVDLEAAQGPITVVGDPVVALEVVTALAVELATNGWSDHLRVTGIDLPPELTALDGARYRATGSLRDVLPELRQHRADALGAGVLTGRLRGSGASAWMPEYVVLGTTPTPEVAAELIQLAATERRSPLGVVCVGELPGARWRLEVDAAGTVAVRLLDLQVRANRLGRAEVAALAELLTPAPEAAEASEAPGAGAELGRRHAIIEHEAALDRPVPTPPGRAVGPADLVAAPVRVYVFGAPRVETALPLARDRVALSTELVVHLALHPGGVHPTVLAAALWPRGVTAAVREAAIARTREWLGADEHGSPHLRQQADGRLALGPAVVLDWDVVRTLLVRSRGASTPAQERGDLADALRLVRGEVLAERAAGRYSWLARARLERSARDLLVDAAHRLAILRWADDDPSGAAEAARAGLRVAPAEELLWRDLLRAAMATGGIPAVSDVAADLERALHSAGIGVAAAPTAALLEELVPGADPAREEAGPA